MRPFARAQSIDLGVLAGLITWAVSIQRPWRAVPLPVTDMGPVLTILRDDPGLAEGTVRLVQQNAALQGRFMPGSMLALAAKVEALGSAGADWRWVSFAVSAALVIAAYLVLRRFHVSPIGALAGASLFINGDHASPAWLLPQVMEPIAALLVIAAIALAMRYRMTPNPGRDAIGVSMLLVAAIWVKEPVVAVVPFVLLVALCWHRAEWDMRPPRERVRTILTSVGVLITLLNVIPILAVRFTATDPDYASRYSATALSIEATSNALRAAMLPVTRVPWFPANVAAAVLIVAGTWIGARMRSPRQALLAVAIPLLLPLSMGLIYAPWPAFPGYYGLPGTFGLALALGVALTNLLRAPQALAKIGAIAAYAVLAILGSILVSGAVATYAAERALESRLARAARDVRGRSVLAYGTRHNEFGGSYGSSLLMYAQHFFGPTSLRSAVDVPCDTATRIAASAQNDTVVVAFGAQCPQLRGEPAISLGESVVARDWRTLRVRVDTVRATLIGASDD